MSKKSKRKLALASRMEKQRNRQNAITNGTNSITQSLIDTTEITILVTSHKLVKYIGLPIKPTHHNNEAIKLRNNTWQNNYDKFGLYNYKTLDEIPAGEKYFIHLTMYAGLLEYYRSDRNSVNRGDKIPANNPYPMPDRVWRDSGNGLVHWIINYSTECNQLDGIDCFDITDINSALNTTPKNVTLITGAATVDTGKSLIENFEYNVATGTELWHFWNFNSEFDKEKQQQKIRSICNKDVMPYKSLNYNRRPRQHRTVIVAHQMHHNYTEALYSLSAVNKDDDDTRWFQWREHFPEYEKEFLKLENHIDIYCNLAEEGYYKGSVNDMSNGIIDIQQNLADKAGWKHALNSNFQLVTETHPRLMKYPFITEKSIKPLGMMMPFIQSAPQYNIKHLREYGVRMFDKWIDQSYDNEPDDILRLRMVLKEFDRLYAIPKEQWVQMLVEMLPDLLHNAFLLMQQPMHSVESQLIPIFLEFLHD